MPFKLVGGHCSVGCYLFGFFPSYIPVSSIPRLLLVKVPVVGGRECLTTLYLQPR